MEMWPDSLRPQRGGRPIYVPRQTAGTIALSGFTQVISADAGTWKFVYDSIPLRGWPDIQLWDTMVLRLEGRLNPFIVTLCEGTRQPLFTNGGASSGTIRHIPHSDQAMHSDGAGYQQAGVRGWLYDNALLRATTIRIVFPPGAELAEPGQYFSIGVRLYQIKSVSEVIIIGPDDNRNQTVTFLPPLREAVASDTEIVFDRPVCKVRLATDNAMERILDGNRTANPSVVMLEDPT